MLSCRPSCDYDERGHGIRRAHPYLYRDGWGYDLETARELVALYNVIGFGRLTKQSDNSVRWLHHHLPRALKASTSGAG